MQLLLDNLSLLLVYSRLDLYILYLIQLQEVPFLFFVLTRMGSPEVIHSHLLMWLKLAHLPLPFLHPLYLDELS